MTTVVSKLFHVIEPDLAVFGQKDAAQLAIIRRMVRDLNIPVQIVAGPIVREPDGLAMSSRNAYLNPQQRKQALVLSRTLRTVQERFQQGERCAEKLIAAGREVFTAEPNVRVDYFFAQRFEGTAGRDHLIQNIGAISILGHQSFEGLNLAANFSQASDERVFLAFGMHMSHAS